MDELDGKRPRVPRPPACCAAGAKAWEWACAGFGCFPALERKHSLPRDALCFPWTEPSTARGAPRGQTLLLCALCHCAVKMSFIPVLAAPRLCAPISALSSHPASLGSELGARTPARAAGLRASRELLIVPWQLSSVLQGALGLRGCLEVTVGRAELLGSAWLSCQVCH